ncbi:MAG: bifunctional glycoside hydrolase 114/ polysaccharide deacetylase family protein [Steroidobacteraceae bacterium]
MSACPTAKLLLSQPAPARVAGVARACVLWALLIISPLFSLAAAGSDALPSVAFYYGEHPPREVLRDFDWVVVQPDALARPETLASPQTTVFGYLSLGEVAQDSAAARALPAQCRLGKNRPWNTWIIDQAQPACRSFYLADVFKPLRAQGYRNFFFDTLDSYRLVLKTAAERRAYRNGLIALIEAMHRGSPQGRFILNRGFELLDALKGQGIVGVAAESLYRGWDPRTGRYITVDPAATRQLLDQLDRARNAGLTAIAIDYLPAAEVTQAERLAQRIASHGIVPYVSSTALDIIGVSTIAPLPRRVLLLYDDSASVLTSNRNRYAAMPLNHLGYATQGFDVTREQLPAGPLTGQVAGIVTWFDSDHFPRSVQTWRWLCAQIKAGVPVAILGTFGMPLSASRLEPLGLRLGKQPPAGLNAAGITHVDRDYFGLENPVLPSAPDFSPIQLAEQGTPLLDIEVGGAKEVAAAITPWGGYVLDPYVLRSLPQGDLPDGEDQSAWILDPFRFLRAALHLPDAPVYDYTTASGRRLLFSLIDGDGFSSGSWIGAFRGEPAAEVILDRVLERFPLPVTASVIASEFVAHGLNPPAEVAELRPLARRIFSLPWVQIGTHTYSHPFDWPALERDPGLSAGLHIEGRPATAAAHVTRYSPAPSLKYGYNLPVPGYRFSPEMEVTGSADIINRALAPPGKRVRVIQWSGDTAPGAEVLGIAYRDGLENINGINSTITRAHPSLTNVVPLGVWQGPYFQVYSPIADEDEYTHLWQPPYCGFSQVIQTMQMTDRPRRLTAMEIYYHYYSGAEPCALRELLQVYRWAERQPATPVFASTYSRIAVAFETAGLARAGNGFLARDYGPDRELRIPAALGYPDLERSRNVAGYDDFDGRRYIHLGPGGEAQLYLQAASPRQPYLKSANGLIEALVRKPETLDLLLKAEVPLAFTLGNATGCRTRIDGRNRHGNADDRGDVRFQLTEQRAQIDITCRG